MREIMISKNIIKDIKEITTKYEDILLVYIFGSSIFHDTYDDIDIGILLPSSKSKYELSRFSMKLARELEKKIGFISHNNIYHIKKILPIPSSKSHFLPQAS